MPDMSPIEVVLDVVERVVNPAVVPVVVVGPLSEDQQELGGVSLMDAGEAKPADAFAVHPRVQIRCIAPSLTQVEQLGRHVGFALNAVRGRIVATQGSTDTRYLVHSISVNGGPSAHRDTQETWEYLLFAEAMIGIDPVE